MSCPLDGSVRTIVDRDRYGVTWKCPWCGGYSREEFEPSTTGDLQREWDR